MTALGPLTVTQPVGLQPPQLSDESTRTLSEVGTYLQLSAGRHLCREDRVQRSILIFLVGGAAISRNGSPELMLRPGHQLGLVSELGRTRWGFSASTFAESHVLALSIPTVGRIAIEFPEVFEELSAH